MTPEAVLSIMGLGPDHPITASQTATMISHMIRHTGEEFATQRGVIQQNSTAIESLRAATEKFKMEIEHSLNETKEQTKIAVSKLDEDGKQLDYDIGEQKADVREALDKANAGLMKLADVEANFKALYNSCKTSFNSHSQSATNRILEI